MQEGSLSGMEGRVEGSRGVGGGVWANGGMEGGHIHSSSFIFSPPSVVVVIAALKLDGGCTVGHSVAQYSEGRGCVGRTACHSR